MRDSDLEESRNAGCVKEERVSSSRFGKPSFNRLERGGKGDDAPLEPASGGSEGTFLRGGFVQRKERSVMQLSHKNNGDGHLSLFHYGLDVEGKKGKTPLKKEKKTSDQVQGGGKKL